MSVVAAGFSTKLKYQPPTTAGAPLDCEWRLQSASMIGESAGEAVVAGADVETVVPIADWIGCTLRFELLGTILCSHCARPTKRSYSQGYCYPCFKRLARCDLCVMSPTRCHYAKGTCREPQWGESFCFAPHVVYLANSSALKVGITRPGQEFTRWSDQGAVQGLVIVETQSRQLAGSIEAELSQWVSDRSNWRQLISQFPEPLRLHDKAAELLGQLGKLPAGAQSPANPTAWDLRYPLQEFAPAKSLKLVASESLEAKLLGIRGQYLLFPQGALNVRNLNSTELRVTNLTPELIHNPSSAPAADDSSQMELLP